MIPLEVRLFTIMPPEVPNLPNYPYVQKNTLDKVIIHSNLQALFTRIPFKHKFLYLSDYFGPLELTLQSLFSFLFIGLINRLHHQDPEKVSTHTHTHAHTNTHTLSLYIYVCVCVCGHFSMFRFALSSFIIQSPFPSNFSFSCILQRFIILLLLSVSLSFRWLMSLIEWLWWREGNLTL